MSRLPIPTLESAPAAAKPLLDAVKSQLGVVPNLFRLTAHSPAALEGLLGLNGALSKTFDPALRERIAIAVAAVNGCEYCLSAHAYLAANLAGLSDDEIARNRDGYSADERSDRLVRFAAKVASERGHVSDDSLAVLKNAGVTDAEIVELVSLVALNMLTNFINNVAHTDIDFPVFRLKAA